MSVGNPGRVHEVIHGWNVIATTRTKLVVLEETAVRFVFSLKAIARNLCLEPGALEPGALEPGALEPGALEPGARSPGAREPWSPGAWSPGAWSGAASSASLKAKSTVDELADFAAHPIRYTWLYV